MPTCRGRRKPQGEREEVKTEALKGELPPNSHTITHYLYTHKTNSYACFQALLRHPLFWLYAELISLPGDPLPRSQGCLGPALPASQEAPQLELRPQENLYTVKPPSHPAGKVRIAGSKNFSVGWASR